MSELERVERVLREYNEEKELFEKFGCEIERLLLLLTEDSKLHINSISHRLKKPDSFERKIRGNDKYESARSVTDFVGARVVTYFEDDVARVAAIIRDEQHFEIDLRNTVDKGLELRSDQFGYQSLHIVASLSRERLSLIENRPFTNLRIEIQIRSLLQHAWAEIQHANYKSPDGIPTSVKRRLSRLAGVLELADEEFIATRDQALFVTKDLRNVRAQGLSELVPDFTIEFPFRALRDEWNLPGYELLLHINTNLTSRITGPATETGVEIYVEEGASRLHLKRGSMVAVNTLAFSDILPIAPSSKRDVIKLRFSGLRVNAFQLGVISNMAPTTIQAQLAIGKKTDDVYSWVPLSKSIDIARVVSSLNFQALPYDRTSDILPLKVSKSEPPNEVKCLVTYASAFLNLFRAADKERSSTEMTTVRGTRLMLRLFPVPLGGRILVSVRDLPVSSDDSCFQLTEADVNGHGPLTLVTATSNRTFVGHDIGFVEAKVCGATAVAVWECTGASQPEIPPSFGIIVVLPSRIEIDEITVNGSFAPLSNVGLASAQDPIPRFGDDSIPITIVQFV